MDGGRFVVEGISNEGQQEVDPSATIQASLIVALEGTAGQSNSSQNYEDSETGILPIRFSIENVPQNPEHEEDDLEPPDPSQPQEHCLEDSSISVEFEQKPPETEASVEDNAVPVEPVLSLLSTVPFPHQSILKTSDEIPILDLSEEVYHCALCPESYTAWPSKEEAADHFKSAHWDPRLEIDEGVNATLCCCSFFQDAHYHCPYCGGTQTNITDMSSHVSLCVQSSLDQQKENEKQEESLNEVSPTAEISTEKTPTCLIEKLGTNYHKSIVREVCDVELKSCQQCCKGVKYHCPLCPLVLCKPQSALKIRQHIVANHWKFRVPFEDMNILKCTAACLGSVNGRPLGPHWHCPLCSRQVSTRQIMRAHLSSHRRGTAHRHRTNTEWARLLGPKDASILFNARPKNSDLPPQVTTMDDVEETCEQPKQVFQTVAALLTQKMVAAIPGSIDAFFSNIQEDSSVQYSSSDQWCLLQGDWNSMSRVHEQLKGLLNCAKQDTKPSQVNCETEPIEDMGAKGDGIHNVAGHDEAEVTDMQTNETSAGGDGVPALTTERSSSEMLPEAVQDVPDGDRLTEPLLSTSVPDGTEEDYTRVDNSTDLPDMSNTPSGAPEDCPDSSTQTEHRKFSTDGMVQLEEQSSPVEAHEGGNEDAVTSKLEMDKDQLSSSSKESRPAKTAKKGRGRKRGIPLERIEKQDTVVQEEPSLAQGTRRRRGRLPKRFEDYDTQSFDTPGDAAEAPEKTSAAPGPHVPPVKRGRGRPPKQKPSIQQLCRENVEGNDAEVQIQEPASQSKRQMTLRGTPAEVGQSEEVNEKSAEGENSSDEIEQKTDQKRKRQKTNDTETPAITISIDETTGNMLSVVFSDNASEVENVDQVKSVTNTNNVIDLDGVLNKGLSLARPRKLVVCEACGRTYPDNHRFYQHVLGSSCIEKRQKQDKNFKISSELEAMITEVKKEVTSPKCPLCQKKFKFVLHAQMHYAEKTCTKYLKLSYGLQKNEETGLYNCRHCDFSADGIQRVITHEMRKHWKKTEQCPICRKAYSCQAFLREHIKAVHAKGKERAVCDQCGVSVSARLIQQHIKIKHDPSYIKPKPKPLTKPIVCQDCGVFETMSYQKFVRHRATMHRPADKKCPHCDQKYSMIGDLNRHIRAVHEGQNQTSGSCPQCGKTMAKKNISAHIKMVHEKRRPHSCYICGRAFLTKYTLQMHIGTHKPADQKDTKFLCAYCGKGFVHKTHYADHLNTHTGARPYSCDICNKTFRCNPALHKHKELHRTINLHCEICNLHFQSRKALRIHNNKEHLKSTTMCRCVCDAEYNSPETLALHQIRCGQWQQANPQENPSITQILDTNLQNQMAMIIEHSDIDQSSTGTYIVLEGKEGEETVMVLQSLENIDGANIVQTVAGSEIMNVANAQPTTEDAEVMDTSESIPVIGSGVKTITSAEVLANLPPADALMVEGQDDDIQAMNMEDQDEQALLTIHQDVDVEQQALGLQDANEQVGQREDLNRYLCGYCQQLFTSLEDVQTHMLAEHVASEGDEMELALHTTTTNLDTSLGEDATTKLI